MKKSLLLSLVILFSGLCIAESNAKGIFGDAVGIDVPAPKKERKLSRKERKALKKQKLKALREKLVEFKKQIKTAEASLPTRAERKGFTKAQKKQYRAKKRALRKAKRTYGALKAYATTGTKVLAVVLWIFLGGLGIHRLAFGASPIVILGYFFTFGGIFGLLPLIDIFYMLIKPGHYEDNSKLFAAFGAK
ncbi:hypothetical protein BKI52_31490 [marine bacterium AO1-C]|nr:hypothetical protein BKI52_31490 [marine bacterium AO1-C]